MNLVLSTVSDSVFKHIRVNDLSLYILANKQYIDDMDAYVNTLITNVEEALRH